MILAGNWFFIVPFSVFNFSFSESRKHYHRSQTLCRYCIFGNLQLVESNLSIITRCIECDTFRFMCFCYDYVDLRFLFTDITNIMFRIFSQKLDEQKISFKPIVVVRDQHLDKLQKIECLQWKSVSVVTWNSFDDKTTKSRRKCNHLRSFDPKLPSCAGSDFELAMHCMKKNIQ